MRALGATLGQPVTVPDGRIMSLEVPFGEAVVMVCDEFPEMGIVSPKGAEPTAPWYSPLTTWILTGSKRWQLARKCSTRFRTMPGAPEVDNLIDPSGHRWGLSSRCPAPNLSQDRERARRRGRKSRSHRLRTPRNGRGAAAPAARSSEFHEALIRSARV